MKKTFLFIIMLAVVITGCASKDGDSKEKTNPDSKQKVVLIIPENIGVNQFFKQMDEGVKQAGVDFNLETKTIQSPDPNAIEQNLRSAVADKYDLIIAATFQMEDALKIVAEENPNQSFAIIDTVVDLPNVRSVVFREYEAAYLLGAAAGLSTKTNKVGMVVAMDIPQMKKYTGGFEQGLKLTNATSELLINYVGSFADPAKAKEIALTQHSQGADFIAAVAAVGDEGVFEAAKEKNFFTASQDTDRTGIDPDHIVLSQLKATDTVAYETVKEFVNGTLHGGVVDYGLKEKGVGLTFVTHESETPLNAFVGEEAIARLKEINDDIIAGTIVVVDPLQQ